MAQDSVGIDLGCFTSRDGLYCTILFILNLILVILCSASNYWQYGATYRMGIVIFSSAYSCVTLLFIGFMYICKLYNASICACLPWERLEIGNCFLSAIFHFMGMATSTVAAQEYVNHYLYGTSVACVILSIIIMLVYFVHGLVIARWGVTMVKERDTTNVPT